MDRKEALDKAIELLTRPGIAGPTIELLKLMNDITNALVVAHKEGYTLGDAKAVIDLEEATKDAYREGWVDGHGNKKPKIPFVE